MKKVSLEIHKLKDTSCTILYIFICMSKNHNLAVSYRFKVIDKHFEIICEICSKLPIKTSVYEIIMVYLLLTLNQESYLFEQISHIVLFFPFLPLSK